jgi:tetratricopeptide (TPR) repeat protein
MRRVWLLLALLAFAAAAHAQEVTPVPVPPVAEAAASRDLAIELAVLRAEQAADTAEQAVNIAGALLNIFDAVAVLLTVLGVVLGVIGFRSIQESRRVSAELRVEAAQLRQQFDEEIRKRERELEQVRQKIVDSSQSMSAQLQRRSDNALVAISLLTVGERQYRAGDYDGAISIYQEALKLDRDNPIIHQRLGYVYCQQGAVESALHHYEHALRLAPELAPALAGMGFVTRRIAERLPAGVEQDLKYNEAEQYLLRALRQSPRLVDDDGESWWGVLGGLYRRRGYLDRAIAAYEEAARVTPQSSYGYGNLALLYMKRGERSKMEEMYRRMETIAASEAMSSQGNFWGYADLIVSRLALGMAQQAAADLPIALNIAPKDADWMLEGLRDTLADLATYLDKPRADNIRDAINTIENALEARQIERESRPTADTRAG